MAFLLRRRNATRIFAVASLVLLAKVMFSSSPPAQTQEIQEQNVLDLVSRSDNVLDVRRHKFLQTRMGRDEGQDIFSDIVMNGVDDYWERFQKP